MENSKSAKKPTQLLCVGYTPLSLLSCNVCKKKQLYNTALIDEERGEVYCGHCGIVLQQKLEYEEDDYGRLSREDLARIGPTSQPYFGHSPCDLSTTIGPQNKDYTGKRISGDFLERVNNIRFWNTRTIQKTKTANEGKRNKIYQKLALIKDKLGLTESIVESAIALYKQSVSTGISRRKPAGVLLGAILYAVCRQCNTPRSIEEIYPYTGASKKRISRCYREILNRLDLRMPSPDPKRCVAKIAYSLGISELIQRVAFEILDLEHVKQYSEGKAPMPIAAAAVYFACLRMDKKKSQRKISSKSGISHVTIRKHVHELESIMQKET